MIILLLFFLFVYSTCAYSEGQPNEFEVFKSEIRLEFAKLKDENRFLKKVVSALETKVSILEKDNVNLRNTVASMVVNSSGATNFPLVEKSGWRLRSNPVDDVLPMEVAFHASVSKNIPLHDNEVIPFDKVLTNLANAYDEHLGIFQAPTPGYYVFFVHFLTLPGKFVEGFLMKDADIILYIYSHAEGPASGNHYGPGSNMVVVYLNTGDRVWVKAHEGHHDTGGLLDNVWNNFSGFLLYSAA